jgi:FtsP/CotA-like multicopper oxidase with cupredoxin domain
MGSSFTYYYNIKNPGTFIYHCHAEATEHMQMGMLGQLYIKPIQNMLPDGTDLNGFTHNTGDEYAYNDGDGSTYYDVDKPLQITAFDPDFHQASLDVQPLPFAQMDDKYPMLNGRGYPDTINPNPLTNTFNGKESQPTSALVEAQVGEKVLLRVSSLSSTNFFTLSSPSIPMTVVGRGAKILRGPGGTNLYYQTTSIDVGGGEAFDVMLDTAGYAPGTYYIYTTNLHNLSNDQEDFGGMMTEIHLSAAN